MLGLEPTSDYLLWSSLLSLQSKLNIADEQRTQLLIAVASVFLTLAFKAIMSFLRGVVNYMSNLRVNLSLSLFNILVVWLPCGRKLLEKE